MKLAFNTVSLPTAVCTSRLVILHGLLGGARNWRSLQKRLAQQLPDHAVTTLDLRNHGDTRPHTPSMTYEEMVEDVALFLRSSTDAGCPTTVIGWFHSSHNSKCSMCCSRTPFS